VWREQGAGHRICHCISPLSLQQTTDLKLKAKIKRKEKEFADAAKEAARSELLLTEDAG